MHSKTKIESIPDYTRFEGKNLAQVLDEQAQMTPTKTFLSHGTRRISFQDFSRSTDHLAAALKARGLSRGEPCGLLFPNGIEYLLFQFALHKLGAVLVPLNTRYRAHELEYMLGFTGARFLFSVGRFLKADFTELLTKLRTSLPRLENIILDGGDIPPGMQSYRDLLDYRASLAEIMAVKTNPVPDIAPATILFTSGTTAKPKGVVMSQRARVWVGIRIAERMQITHRDTLMNPLPFCHEFGGFTIPSHAVICACKMVIMDVFDGEEALRLIEKEKVSVLYGVPTMFSYMLNSPSLPNHDLRSLRTGYMSGATCPLELVRRVQDQMGCNISVAYGSSEAPSHTISEYGDAPEVKAGTAGKPVRGAGLKIVDKFRREVAPGQPGVIALRGQNLFSCYFNNPEATRSALGEDGYFYTDDLGRLNRNGYLEFVGRQSEMIVTGGFNVSPLEVEEVLYKLPYVAHAAVIGLPHETLGEQVCACIVCREGVQPSQDEIIEFCRKQMSNYKVPSRIEFMESLPVTLTNKVKRNELTEILREKK